MVNELLWLTVMMARVITFQYILIDNQYIHKETDIVIVMPTWENWDGVMVNELAWSAVTSEWWWMLNTYSHIQTQITIY